MKQNKLLQQLQQRIGYEFKDKQLLQRALTHRSFSSVNYERLEFLGDAVLGMVISEWLYAKYDSISEGDLSRARANLVNQDSLAEVALSLAVAQCLRLGEGELNSGGRHKPSILADVVEAIIAAVYLDGGFVAAQQVVTGLFKSKDISFDAAVKTKDAKTKLQEYMQQRKKELPKYDVQDILGAEHQQTFVVQCRLPELGIQAVGKGSSKRAAEQNAADLVLKQLLAN